MKIKCFAGTKIRQAVCKLCDALCPEAVTLSSCMLDNRIEVVAAHAHG